MSAWNLQPEMKWTRAQEAQRGVAARLTALLGCDCRDEMSADEIEVLALQLKLASVNLMVAARELREVEEERRYLAREVASEAMRFEKEDEL